MTFAVTGTPLLHLVNSCVTRCDMPAAWKLADVTPLHKKGDRCDPSNYRPISIIPAVAKLCEEVVCSQLMTYLERHSDLPTAVWLPARQIHGGGDVQRSHMRHREYRQGSRDVTRHGRHIKGLRQRRASPPPGQAGLVRDPAGLVR